MIKRITEIIDRECDYCNNKAVYRTVENSFFNVKVLYTCKKCSRVKFFD